jgi:hypothetical protein
MTTLARAQSAAPGPSLRTIHDDDGLLLASFGPVLVASWSSKPTPRTFEHQRSELEAAVRANPGRQLFLCIVAPNAPPPDDAERDGSARMISAHGDKLLGCACVIEGQGFRAAITRTVLTGIVLLIRTPSPVVFFERVKQAELWLQQRAPRVNLGELSTQLEQRH